MDKFLINVFPIAWSKEFRNLCVYGRPDRFPQEKKARLPQELYADTSPILVSVWQLERLTKDLAEDLAAAMFKFLQEGKPVLNMGRPEQHAAIVGARSSIIYHRSIGIHGQ